MLDNEILDEIETTYANHEKLPTIINELRNDAHITFWADHFSTEAYGHNTDLAAELFEYAQSRCEHFRDYKELAFALANQNGFNDKEWAKEMLDMTIIKIDKLRDLIFLADDLARKNLRYYDRDLARSLYVEAIEKSKTAYDYYEIAVSLCNAELLDDQEWAEEIYSKAIEVCENEDELTTVADSIAEDLGDENWSEELYKLADKIASGEAEELE